MDLKIDNLVQKVCIDNPEADYFAHELGSQNYVKLCYNLAIAFQFITIFFSFHLVYFRITKFQESGQSSCKVIPCFI